MTDHVRFVQAFNRLAVAMRLPAADADAAAQRVYWDGLQGLSIAALEIAATQLTRTATWFPKVSEWRVAAAQAEREVALRALPRPRDEPWRVECEACDDSGWQRRLCGGDVAICGRPRSHASHAFVAACPCRETNHTYQRQRAGAR